jgi:hypothetical protein
MGTSTSPGGPRGPFPLLPPWAQGGGGEGPGPAPDGDGPAPEPAPDPAAETAANGNGTPQPPPGMSPAVPLPMPAMGNLGRAKNAMSRAASGGGGAGRIRRAAQRYVSGRGGSRAAARSAQSGRQATQRLGGFLSAVAAGGLRAAVEGFRLDVVLGQPIEEVFAAIANAIAPAGATLEEAAARRAVDDALCLLYERVGLQDGDFARLDKVDANTVREVLQASVAGYIYNRWLQEVGDRIERRSVSADAAVNLERQVRQFVTETVRIDFAEIDVLRYNWADPQGRELVERIYRDAYSLLEE